MPQSLLSNVECRTGRPIVAAPDGSVLLSSGELGWRGMTAELHRIAPAHQPEHVVQTHRLMIHVGASTRFEFHEGGNWRARQLVPGTLSMLAHGMTNEPRWHDTMEFVAIALDPAFVTQSFGDALAHGNSDLRPVRAEPDPIATRFAGLIKHELAEASFTGALFGETVALGFARHLLGRYGAGVAEPRGALSGPQLARVVEHLHAHLSEDTSLEALAAHAHVSPYHFARLFRAATGVSPHQFVLKLRVERAQRLIRTNKASTLTDIGAAAGFFDQAHFSKAFKRLTGVTPSTFAAG